MAIRKTNFTFPSASKEDVTIQCFQWKDDAQTPVGVVQITHGLTENTEMFEDLAIHLAKHGYICAGMDLLGHGATAGPGCGGITPDDTNEAIWKDMFTFYSLLREKYPDLPHFSYSHSMGSVMFRAFLAMYADKVDIKACFLSGDSSLPSWLYKLIPAAEVLGRMISPYKRSLKKRRKNFVLKNYGQNPPLLRRLPLFWLSFDKQNIVDYINNPYTVGANDSLIHVVGFMVKALSTFALGDKEGWEYKIPDQTLLHHGCGHWDVPGLLGFGPKNLHRRLQKAGKKTELHLYWKAMHEPHGERAIRDEWNADLLRVFHDNNPLL